MSTYESRWIDSNYDFSFTHDQVMSWGKTDQGGFNVMVKGDIKAYVGSADGKNFSEWLKYWFSKK